MPSPKLRPKKATIGPAGITSDEQRDNRPRSIRPSTFSEKVYDFVEPGINVADKFFDFIAGETPEEQLLNAINPLETPAAAAASIIPHRFLRQLADETAQKVVNTYGPAGFPKTGEIVSNMIGKHWPITGQTKSVIKTGQVGNVLGGYKRIGTETVPSEFRERNLGLIEKILRNEPTNDPTLGQLDAALTSGVLPDFNRASLARELLGEFDINPVAFETNPIEGYKTLRHEISHAADDITGRSLGVPIYNSNHPLYWVNPTEVRARAVERGYRKDIPIDQLDPGVRPGPFRVAGGKPTPYRKYISSSLTEGEVIGLQKLAQANPTLSQMPDFYDYLSKVVNYYIGSEGKLSSGVGARNPIQPPHWSSISNAPSEIQWPGLVK